MRAPQLYPLLRGFVLGSFVVLGREEWEGAPTRLRVDAPPFYVWPRDVVLTWNSKGERLAALLDAGHTR